jgi:hypothetical protein
LELPLEVGGALFGLGEVSAEDGEFAVRSLKRIVCVLAGFLGRQYLRLVSRVGGADGHVFDAQFIKLFSQSEDGFLQRRW